MKVLKEWSIEAPWGNIALMSWGDPNGEPVLLVHGRQDSVATFIPLLEHLPEKYHYVGMDMPGNGKSSPLPHGVKILRMHFVSAVDIVIKHLQWTELVYIGHSMGCETGLFYNTVSPGRIKKMVCLDLRPSLQRLQVHNLVEYYNDFFYEYYKNYHRDNFESKLYSKRKALDAVMKARGLTEPQAELILSRNLVPAGDDSYRLSWDLRLKTTAPQNYPADYYYQLFSKNAPPILVISATDESFPPYTKGKEAATEIIGKLEKNLKHFRIVTVKGGHDVHFTNPERLAKEVMAFVERDFGEMAKPEMWKGDVTEIFGNISKAKL